MDPRLQAAVVRHRRGERTRATAASGPDEISVIAVVTCLAAFTARRGVREGTTIGETPDGTLVTAWVPISEIVAIRRGDEVKSLKAAQRLSRTLDATVPDIQGGVGGPSPGINTNGGAGVVVGIVDSGGDFAHHNFRRVDGNTRLLALWDQEADPLDGGPVKYGRSYGAADINTALQASDPYARLGYAPRPDRFDEQGVHGTHVMDIAAGNGLGSGVVGVAPQADLVFVDPAPSDVHWRGSAALVDDLGDSRRVLDAIEFIFGVAEDRPCVVNLSIGTNGGPHDGTSLVEQGIDTLLSARPNRAVVLAASNAFGLHVHASGTVAQGAGADIVWRRPLKRDEVELELWYSGSDVFSAELFSGRRSVGTVELGSSRELESQVFVSHRAKDSVNGDNVIGVFLGAGALGRDWTVRLGGTTIAAGGRFHAWLERNDWGQARFLSPRDDSHTVSSIACGRLSIVVGSYDARRTDHRLSVYSSAGPTRDGRHKPEVSAPGEQVNAARSRSGTKTTPKSGTSMAAPAVSGLIAVLLSEARARGRNLSAEQIRDMVRLSARSDPPAANAWHPQYGFGRVSVQRALAQLPQ